MRNPTWASHIPTRVHAQIKKAPPTCVVTASYFTVHTEDINSELRNFVRQRFSIPEDDPDFTDDVDLFNYGYIDSLGAVELTSFVEQQFGVAFTDSDWVNFPLSSIREISRFIANRIKGEI